MPRKPKLPALEVESPKPAKVTIFPLEYEQRKRLVALLNDPVFVMAWRNAQLSKPTWFPMNLDTALGNQIASNRLHQLQGWTLFEAALLRQTDDPKAGKPRVDETYPDPPELKK